MFVCMLLLCVCCFSVCESEYVRVPCICVLRVECSVCERAFVFVVCMINTRKHARRRSCVCVVYMSIFFKCCVTVCSCIVRIGMCVLFCFQCFRVSLQFAIPIV